MNESFSEGFVELVEENENEFDGVEMANVLLVGAATIYDLNGRDFTDNAERIWGEIHD